jgi:drug/metabolite transporter (DMT)-like permease
LTRRLSPSAEPPGHQVRIIAGFAAIYLFWGGTFLAIRYAVREVPPLLTIAIRCVGGALILYAWLRWRGGLERPTARQWVTSGIAGAFLFIGCHGVLAWAEQRVSSGQAALYLSCIPLWLVLITSVKEHRVPSKPVIAGLVLGVLGVSLLARGSGPTSGTLLDRLALLGSDLSWAIGSIVARDGPRPTSAAQSTAMQLGTGGIAVLVLSLAVGELERWSPWHLTLHGGLALFFLVLGGTVLGFGAYTWLLRVASPAAVGTYAFVNPLVALCLGWATRDEPFSLRTIAAAAVIVIGVLLTWKSSSS